MKNAIGSNSVRNVCISLSITLLWLTGFLNSFNSVNDRFVCRGGSIYRMAFSWANCLSVLAFEKKKTNLSIVAKKLQCRKHIFRLKLRQNIIYNSTVTFSIKHTTVFMRKNRFVPIIFVSFDLSNKTETLCCKQIHIYSWIYKTIPELFAENKAL